MTALHEILENTRRETAMRKQRLPLAELRRAAESAEPRPSLAAALARPGVNIIAEVKMASPSKGVLCTNFDAAETAQTYERGGAAAVSVLTDERFFGGSLLHLDQVTAAVDLPVLRKDFILDAYQVYEAKAHSASAVLLLAAALNDAELSDLAALCAELDLDALVEVHDERELERALRLPVPIIGVNNRDLRTFAVDLQTSLRLAPLLPRDRVCVSESGISSAQEIAVLRAAGYSGFLVGETLMRAQDRLQALRLLRGDHVD